MISTYTYIQWKFYYTTYCNFLQESSSLKNKMYEIVKLTVPINFGRYAVDIVWKEYQVCWRWKVDTLPEQLSKSLDARPAVVIPGGHCLHEVCPNSSW